MERAAAAWCWAWRQWKKLEPSQRVALQKGVAVCAEAGDPGQRERDGREEKHTGQQGQWHQMTAVFNRM
ncbi:hypothetical protein COCCADRAFT_108772 [Bipolaris zeicola 26-R-13]|uniref:Uncharacterized protein n=1 Tax=Cochliobolus carbonum (strain 26-R-13) TaxID=930089 RepID=W6Y0Q3_COCC2|nr:uncharacterized protein COCCADRAFT_108772 [Bipolaris zeicola 26-R-13]EUC28579.1 hypothetical protein COCCADRAFT_108772 [Bipolaris zeicola 26-R-13]